MYVPEKILSGDIPAQSTAEQVETVVREHARFVYRVAYAVLNHPQEAEDAAQETFIRVWKHAQELSGVLNQRAWLARIAWRVASDRRRKNSGPVIAGAAELPEIVSGGTAADEVMIRAQQAELLERMMVLLPGDLREALVLSTVEEMTSVEIAVVLGIPESSVRGRLLRARQILKEKVQILMDRQQKK